MRLWSIDFKHLDQQGLCGLWREAVQAKNILQGATEGYKNHSSLDRFKASDMPLTAINTYLSYVLAEAKKRRYNFNQNLIDWRYVNSNFQIPVTIKQIRYEANFLKSKLSKRQTNGRKFLSLFQYDICPFFYQTEGEIENWERVKNLELQK